MKKPKQIDILGKTYKIAYKNTDCLDYEGLFDDKRSTIIVNEKLEGEELAQTLLHEFFHGVCRRSGVSQAIDCGVEEILVDVFATFLVDNFEFYIDDE